MLEKTFGVETREHVEEMVKKPSVEKIVSNNIKSSNIDFNNLIIANKNTPNWYKGELFV